MFELLVKAIFLGVIQGVVSGLICAVVIVIGGIRKARRTVTSIEAQQ